MDISEITKHKKTVDERLISYLEVKRETSVNEWQQTLIDKLSPFVVSGKSIRGSLVMYGYLLFSNTISDKVLDAAAAIELFHSGFLIHDDIMDKDELRRGAPSLHTQYEAYGTKQSARDANHFGISMGINAADFCFFCGYELLSETSHELVRTVSAELAVVTAAQMQDVAASMIPTPLTEEMILNVYRYKTARYTFSLPLSLGARIAGADISTVKALEQIGEAIGNMFQIRDDELSLLGDSIKTGKPIGNDQREHKQTLLALYVQDDHPEIEVQTLSPSEFAGLYQDSAAQKKIAHELSKLAKQVAQIIETIPLTPAQKKTLIALADYVQKRQN